MAARASPGLRKARVMFWAAAILLLAGTTLLGAGFFTADARTMGIGVVLVVLAAGTLGFARRVRVPEDD